MAETENPPPIFDELSDEDKKNAVDLMLCMVETTFQQNDGESHPALLESQRESYNNTAEYGNNAAQTYAAYQADSESLGDLTSNCPTIKAMNPKLFER